MRHRFVPNRHTAFRIAAAYNIAQPAHIAAEVIEPRLIFFRRAMMHIVIAERLVDDVPHEDERLIAEPINKRLRIRCGARVPCIVGIAPLADKITVPQNRHTRHAIPPCCAREIVQHIKVAIALLFPRLHVHPVPEGIQLEPLAITHFFFQLLLAV